MYYLSKYQRKSLTLRYSITGHMDMHTYMYLRAFYNRQWSGLVLNFTKVANWWRHDGWWYCSKRGWNMPPWMTTSSNIITTPANFPCTLHACHLLLFLHEIMIASLQL